MTGHHKFNQLIENISPERKTIIAKKTAQIKQEQSPTPVEVVR